MMIDSISLLYLHFSSIFSLPTSNFFTTVNNNLTYFSVLYFVFFYFLFLLYSSVSLLFCVSWCLHFTSMLCLFPIQMDYRFLLHFDDTRISKSYEYWNLKKMKFIVAMYFYSPIIDNFDKPKLKITQKNQKNIHAIRIINDFRERSREYNEKKNNNNKLTKQRASVHQFSPRYTPKILGPHSTTKKKNSPIQNDISIHFTVTLIISINYNTTMRPANLFPLVPTHARTAPSTKKKKTSEKSYWPIL